MYTIVHAYITYVYHSSTHKSSDDTILESTSAKCNAKRSECNTKQVYIEYIYRERERIMHFGTSTRCRSFNKVHKFALVKREISDKLQVKSRRGGELREVWVAGVLKQSESSSGDPRGYFRNLFHYIISFRFFPVASNHSSC